MKTVLIDIDDTILDLVNVWLDLYNAEYNQHLTKEQITNWAIGSFSTIGEEFYKYLSMENLNIYYATPPMEDALEGVILLRSLGYQPYFVTASDFRSRKYDWLLNHGFMLKKNEYIVCYDKSMIQANLIIDDKPDYIQAFDVMGIPGYLVNQPWNREFECKNRVKNWTELIQRIKEDNL